MITEEQSIPEYTDEDITALQRELQEANGALQKAIEEKNSAISKGDVAVMKNIKRPTEHALLIASLVSKIFNVKTVYVKSTKTNDYWTSAVKLFNSKYFLSDVQNYDVS